MRASIDTTEDAAEDAAGRSPNYPGCELLLELAKCTRTYCNVAVLTTLDASFYLILSVKEMLLATVAVLTTLDASFYETSHNKVPPRVLVAVLTTLDASFY